MYRLDRATRPIGDLPTDTPLPLTRPRNVSAHILFLNRIAFKGNNREKLVNFVIATNPFYTFSSLVLYYSIKSSHMISARDTRIRRLAKFNLYILLSHVCICTYTELLTIYKKITSRLHQILVSLVWKGC